MKYYCGRCGNELTDDEIRRNDIERRLSLPGDWEIEKWTCDACFHACQPDSPDYEVWDVCPVCGKKVYGDAACHFMNAMNACYECSHRLGDC